MAEFLKNNKGLEVLTDTGWSHFDGLAIKCVRNLIEITTEHTSLKCTPEHNLFQNQFSMRPADTFTSGTSIQGKNSIELVLGKNSCPPEIVFDLVNVEKNNRFYANDLLIKNCNFIIFDETLINPFKLSQMEGIDPIEKTGQVRWYRRPTKDGIYLCALDPSMGTGGDPSAIQVFEAGTNKQIAEWTHNKTPIENQVKLLKEITSYLVSITNSPSSVYWSVENNTLGEAALVTIRHIGEENIPGIFLSEPVRLGNVRKFRKGFNTTNTVKLTACAKLKQLVESDRIHIYSRKLISELKTFVSSENTFKAKIGETDDLVMAVITIVRMIETLKNYIPSMNEIQDKADESTMPLPFLMNSSSSRLY